MIEKEETILLLKSEGYYLAHKYVESLLWDGFYGKVIPHNEDNINSRRGFAYEVPSSIQSPFRQSPRRGGRRGVMAPSNERLRKAVDRKLAADMVVGVPKKARQGFDDAHDFAHFIHKAKEVLREVELGKPNDFGVCPICRLLRIQDNPTHAPDCALAELLREG